jgi:hypothetical protein
MDIESFENGAIEKINFQFRKDQLQSEKMANAKLKILNPYGFNGIESPEYSKQMVRS